MVGKEDVSGSARVPMQPSGSRKMFWRSASWSASRTSPDNLETEDKEHSDPNGGIDNHNGHNRRFPVPLTPRSQQNCKARSCLPPLQPLSIARRSLDEWPKAGSDDIGEWQQPQTPSGKGGGERLKLDLSSIQHNADKNGGLVRRDKIAFFDKKCSKVAEHIYLGGDAVARDKEILKHNGITHVLNCVGFVCPEYFKADFVYRTLWLQDSPSEDITSILYDVFDYFEDVREQGGRVFVHCCQGVSRSTSLVIAYLMWREGQSFDDAFQYVKAARGIADPNMGFACQLLQCQKRVHAVPLSPSSLLRMYRIAPHSPYDPLHLVPKMLNEPSPSALDSRGAFIIHVPSAIYVWIGKNCEAIMERDGRGAVCQIVRYERVQGPITLFKEGEEPTCFWEAFSNLLPLMDKTGGGLKVRESALKIYPGGRKVNSYDVDFEIFQKAIRGGFVPPLATAENEHETLLPARESSWSMLRRKFAPGSMKEFISAPKISLTRIYSDSMMLVHSPKHVPSPSPSSSLASSSSSPLFLSSDSISSEPSTNSPYSESFLDSPSAVSCSLPVSSVTSCFSNLSVISSEPSCKSVSITPETLVVNVTSQPCLESTLSTSKKTSPSLAHRRGSLTKSLKLPVINDKIRVANVPSSILVHQEDGVSANGSSCSSLESTLSTSKKTSPSLAHRRGSLTKSLKLPVINDKIRVANVPSSVLVHQEDGVSANVSSCSTWGTDSMGRALPSKHGVENGDVEATQQYKIIAKNVPSPDSAQKENAFIEHCGNLWREDQERLSTNEESGSEGCNVMHPLVCRWPSLEKVSTFSVNDLDTKVVFAILSQNADLGKNVPRLLYFWVGRSFNLRECQVQLDSDRVLDVEEIDWKQVGSDVLVQMGLPKDAVVKVVKEDEEPKEFLELLNRL